MEFFNKLKKSIVVVLMPIVSYFILGPLEIYFGNKKDFEFQYTDFLGSFLLIAVIVLVVLSCLLAVFPERISKYLRAMVLGVGVASYIQNMFMNIKLSEGNGGPMQWETLQGYTVFNTIVYLLIIVACVVFAILLKKKWDSVSVGIAGFLSAIQLVAVVSLIIPAMLNGESTSKLQMSGEKQYKVASEENIIVFVLDTFGNRQMEDIFEQYPEAESVFADFTYYDNADCHYYVTFPSMTHMLTGEEFDFNVGCEEWLATAWDSDRALGFFEELEKAGYERNMYAGDAGYVYGDMANLEGKFDNIQPMELKADKTSLVGLLTKMSVYRYAPYAIKPYFEVLTNDFDNVVTVVEGSKVIDDNGLFYQALNEQKLSVDEDMDKLFVIQHLFGTHAPYTIDANAQMVEESSQLEVGRGLLTVLEEYFHQLKELGVYDDSVIIVTADHGAWWGGDTQPIYFIKEANSEKTQMVRNDAPISADDFQATILDIIDSDYSHYGTTIYDWNSGDERERTVYMIGNDENYPEVQGSTFNVYYKYTYMKDTEELNQNVDAGPNEILPATGWAVTPW